MWYMMVYGCLMALRRVKQLHQTLVCEKDTALAEAMVNVEEWCLREACF